MKRRVGTTRPVLSIILAATLSVAGVAGCSSAVETDPISIGYIGGITGGSSDLGLAGRNAVELAVEDLNAKGGIGGRRVSLEIVDDAQDAQTAKAALRSLKSRGVVAVVGPMTSSMAIELVPLADELEIPLVSPTTSTDALSGLDDYFFRTYPDNASAATEMADVIVERFGAKRVVAVYDLGNRAHSESWAQNLGIALGARGSSMIATETFTSGSNQDFATLARACAERNPDCVFLVANSTDTILACQQLRVAGVAAPIVVTEWSSTEDVVRTGGTSVDGILFLNTFDRFSEKSSYVRFRDAYLARYSLEPGFAATHAYDCTSLIASALDSTPDGSSLRDALADARSINVLQGTIDLDEFGDATHAYYLMTIRGGELQRASP